MDAIRQRLAQTAQLRSNVLSSLTAAPAAPPLLSMSVHPLPSQRHKMLSHYHPDVDLLALSRQDPSLKDLRLKDEYVETKLKKEEELKKRGKVVRVGVLTGQHVAQSESKSKKKRK